MIAGVFETCRSVAVIVVDGIRASVEARAGRRCKHFVLAYRENAAGAFQPFFRQFFGDQFFRQMPREQREHSLGSGVIVTEDGYILTNNHVVDKATDIKVALPDKREFKGKVVGSDPKTDVAMVKISASSLPTLSFGDSDKLQVGDYVFVIGDPFGIGETATMEIVSGTGRGGLAIEDYEDFLQTDPATLATRGVHLANCLKKRLRDRLAVRTKIRRRKEFR